MKKILLRIADAIYSVVFAVGCFAIYEFSAARQPFMAKTTMLVLGVAAACGFLWMSFIRPLLAELKERPNETAEPKDTAISPSATPQPTSARL